MLQFIFVILLGILYPQPNHTPTPNGGGQQTSTMDTGGETGNPPPKPPTPPPTNP